MPKVEVNEKLFFNLVGNDNLSDGELDRKRAEMVRRILAGG